MKRTLTLFAAILLLAVGATAQKLSYQAVVRNTANELVYDAQVTVSLKILAADGTTVQYAETQTATTNQNGLLTIIIGESSSAIGSLTNIIWANASIRTDITLPTGDVVTNIMPVTAVPYALYADDAGGNLDQVQSDWTETNTESKAYILHKPTIPTAVSQLTNDVHYITVNQVPAQVQSDWAETNTASTAYIQNKPAIPTSVGQLTNDVHYITVNEVPVQVQSDWAETNTASTAYIQNKPAIPTSVGQLTNDVHYITVNEVPVQVQSDWLETNTASTAYIQNKPTIPTVPTNVSAFQNDAHYVTQTQMESTGYLTRDSIVVLQQTVNNLVALVNSLNMRMTQEQFTTIAGQTVFTLQHAPKQDCIIRCYVNGVMVGGNHNGVLEINADNNMQVVYSASFNRNYALKANDRVTIVYWY